MQVLQQCFNIEVENGIPLTSVKKLLNGDLAKESICRFVDSERHFANLVGSVSFLIV